MVARMVGNHHSLKPAALGQTGGSSQHNTVAERHHSAFHIVEVVFAFGDGVGAFEQRAVEEFADKAQVDYHQFYSQAVAMVARALKFARIVVGPVGKVDGKGDGGGILVQHGH